MHEAEIFSKAIEVPTEAERQKFLENACANDQAMLCRLNALIESHQNAGNFLEPLPDVEKLGGIQPMIEKPGAMVGPYRLLQQIGEGGFGIVFLAEQKTPIRRKVAVKIIKPGMDTAEVIARFESERQALALMDHPSIARVLDAGATDSGRPYFVMELIRGEPITVYCDQKKVATNERLALFVQVCHAVQHAHQKGVIHRDMKPSNVLVTADHEQATPKVIDFGVAKATTQSLTDNTVFTHYGQMIGSLHYMSPEQAVMSSMDVDTRSDIYSLGVLLYELLTGEPPFHRKRFQGLSFEQSQQIIRDEEPPTPSTRVGGLGETSSGIATSRRIEARKLPSLLRGELDWIVMKALEKDRTRRYQTANDLGQDILRFLNGEAVEAGPPSTTYKLRKLARKHDKLLITSASFAILLVVAATLSTWLAIHATRARRAELAERNRVVKNYANIIAKSPERFTYSSDLTTFVFVAAFTSGDWERAKVELRQASEQIGGKRPLWWQTHWWTVGPYPANLSASYPPETHLDPFQPVPTGVPGSPPLRWIPNTANSKGGVGIGNTFIGEGVSSKVRRRNSAYLQTRIFVAEQRKVNLVFRAKDQARIWLNGWELSVNKDQVSDQIIARVELQTGWNTLLAHVVNRGLSNHNFYLRLKDPLR